MSQTIMDEIMAFACILWIRGPQYKEKLIDFWGQKIKDQGYNITRLGIVESWGVEGPVFFHKNSYGPMACPKPKVWRLYSFLFRVIIDSYLTVIQQPGMASQ